MSYSPSCTVHAMSRLGLVSCRILMRGVYPMRCSTESTVLTRQYCQNINVPKPQAAKASSGQNFFRDERKITNIDKKVLVWAGRFKKEDDVPAYVSCDVLSAARSNVRIKISMAMVVGTILGCIAMIISGKKAMREENSLYQMNSERKAKWREEAEQEKASIKNH